MGNANDEVGSNDFTIYGATLTTDRFGMPNRAYHFAGTNMEVASTSLGGMTEATVSVWIRPDSISATKGINVIFYMGAAGLSTITASQRVRS